MLRVSYVGLRIVRASISLQRGTLVLCFVVWGVIAAQGLRSWTLWDEWQREPTHSEHFWWDAELDAATHAGRRRREASLRRRIALGILRATRHAHHHHGAAA